MNLHKELPKLVERKIKLSTLDIQPRVFNNWIEQGAVSDPFGLKDGSNKNTKANVPRRMYLFNAFEVLWLLIVKELRMLNMSLDNIGKLKEFMFKNPFDNPDNIIDEAAFSTVLNKTLPNELLEDYKLRDLDYKALKKEFKKLPEDKRMFFTRIGSMLGLVLTANLSPSIHIIKNPHGEALKFLEFYPEAIHAYGIEKGLNPIEVIMGDFATQTIINLPIKPLVNQFFYNDKLFKFTKAYEFLSDTELGVLKVFRAGDFNKMVIHKNDKDDVITFERTTNEDLKGERAKELRKLLGLKDYKSVQVIDRNDKHLVINKTNKTKIDLSNP